MGENGSPPLSRRVPGTTSMPRAQVRRSPPRLPDSVIEKLKAEVQAARAKEAEDPDAQYPAWSEEAPLPEPPTVSVPRRSKLTAFPRRPRTPEPEEPLDPMVAPFAKALAPPLPVRPTPASRPTPAPRIERPKLAPLHEDIEADPQPQRPKAAPIVEQSTAPPVSKRPQAASRRERPRVVPQWMQKAEEAPQPELDDWHVVPDSPRAPVAESDDITEPIPVVAPAGTSGTARPIRDLVNDQAAPAAPERERRQVHRAPARSKPATGRSKPATVRPNPAVGRSKPGTARSKVAAPTLPKASAPRLRKSARTPSTADNQGTKLQALFSEMSDFEEVVASARAQAGRPLAGVEWRYVFAAAGLAALILVVVVVFMVELVG
jgi:hypothetical protein